MKIQQIAKQKQMHCCLELSLINWVTEKDEVIHGKVVSLASMEYLVKRDIQGYSNKNFQKEARGKCSMLNVQKIPRLWGVKDIGKFKEKKLSQ